MTDQPAPTPAPTVGAATGAATRSGGSGRHRRVGRSDPVDRLVPIGVAMFAVGTLAIVTIFLPGLFHGDRPLWLNLLTLLAPAGFGLALLGVWLSARRTGDGRRPQSG